MEFFEAPAFTRYLPQYLDDDGYRALQRELARNPEAGDIIPGTGGFRKVRWADTRRAKGRRGGLRVIYFHFAAEHQIWLMTLYGKNEAADLTPGQKKALKAAVERERKARETARRTGRTRRRKG
jgi:hypothetical protein